MATLGWSAAVLHVLGPSVGQNDRRVVKWILLGDPVPHGTRAVGPRAKGSGDRNRSPAERTPKRPSGSQSERRQPSARAGGMEP